MDLKGKCVAVIGVGASGVQVIQQARRRKSVYQRTPNLIIPMHQTKMSQEENTRLKKEKYKEYLKANNETFAGFEFDFLSQATFDVSEEERNKIY